MGIDFNRYSDNLEALLKIDINEEPFNFQKSLNIDARNNQTKCIDRKDHLFLENPTIDAKINDLMATISNSGKASAKLVMTGDSKDSRQFFLIKKKELEEGTQLELSFVDSLFMKHRLREKISRIQADVRAYQSVQQYTHNFGDLIFYKSMKFRSSYL